MNRRGEKVAGIVLAAGESTRMGKIKQLLPIGDTTLIERVLGEVLISELDRVVLVLGHRAREIKESIASILPQPRLNIIENHQFRQGISSSIVAGISEVEKSHDHVMIFLADMPCIDGDLINLLLRRYLASGMQIGAIKGKERPGHPVIFSRELYQELQALRGDVGARSLLRKYSDRVCLVEPEKCYDSIDIDTPEDYAGFQRSLQNGITLAS
ncbi:MAG: nucleotidyltransferase family protein [Proteobacteria bacterium]|nr:nucleotidyltransferase family protein [Pseudomonadota bacterium]